MQDDNTDLKSAVRDALERKGVIKDIRARLRASVFNCLEDKSTPSSANKSKDLYMSTELVRDFLVSMGLSSTLAVFCQELGETSEVNSDREFIAGELGFSISSQDEEVHGDSIPLLTLFCNSRHQKNNMR
jgi:hypothetical protein